MVRFGPARNEALRPVSDSILGGRIGRVRLDGVSVLTTESTRPGLPGREHFTAQESPRSAAARSTSQGRGG